MKLYEKVLLFALLPFLFIWYGARKLGGYMGRKAKAPVAVLVAAIMLISAMPLTAFAASVPDGYTTDTNGVMAYTYKSSGEFDIQGYYGGNWKKTTFGNGGYYTYLKQNEVTSEINAVSSLSGGYTQGNLNVSIDFDFTGGGKTVQILYTVKNNGSQTETFSLGTGADIQIGHDDSAYIIPFDDGSGFKMVSDNYDDIDSVSGEYAQFNFFATGYKGVTDVSDYWYGTYYSSDSTTGAYWSGNRPVAAFYGNNVSETGNFDSAGSWHWAEQTLPSGETATYSILIGVGGADSEDSAQSSVHRNHPICGDGGCTDAAHAVNETWIAWDGSDTDTIQYGLQLTSGKYFLEEDIVLSDTIEISGDVTLCLNGKVIDGKNIFMGPIINVAEGSSFTLTDCGTDEYKFAPDSDGLWVLDENGTETVTGGVITGGEYSFGSAIACKGKLYIYGGNIVGNESSGRAAIYVSGDEFIMYGGSICGNAADKRNSGVALCFWNSSGICKLYGGKIHDNRCADGSDVGAGVNVVFGTLCLSGDIEIYNNTSGELNSNIFSSSITVDGELNNSTPIGLAKGRDGVIVIPDGSKVTDVTSYIGKFDADHPGYFLSTTQSGSIEIKAYAITQHPTSDNGYEVITNCEGDVDGYTWHDYDTETYTVGDTNGSGSLAADTVTDETTSSYASGVWTPACDLYGESLSYFTLELKKGDVLKIQIADGYKFSSYHNSVLYGSNVGYIFSDEQSSDLTQVTVTIPSDDIYTVNLDTRWIFDEEGHFINTDNASDITISAEVTKVQLGLALENEDSSTFGGGTAGASYVCKVIFKDGTAIVSDPFVYILPGYTIKYEKNHDDASGQMDDQNINLGIETELSENAFTRPGYNFVGWNDQADGQGADYADKDRVTDLAQEGESITLYAKWEIIAAGAPIINGTSADLENSNALTYGDIDSDDKVTVDASAPSDAEYDLSYQWYKSSTGSKEGSTAISGAESSSYIIPSDSSAGEGWYWCVVTATRRDNGDSESAETRLIHVVINRAGANIIAPDAADDLVYNTAEHDLIIPGTVDVGTMQYALGTDASTAPTDGWTTEIPTGIYAGSYYVWYRAVINNDNYSDDMPGCVTVNIARAQIEKPTENQTEFIYSAEELTYTLTENDAYIISNNIRRAAGSQTVAVSLKDKTNYEWTDGTDTDLSFDFVIEQKELIFNWLNTSLTYTGVAQKPILNVEGIFAQDEIVFTVEGEETNANADGEHYTASVTSMGGRDAANYKLPADLSCEFTIEKATPSEVIFPTASSITYGDPLRLSSLDGGSGDGSFAWENSDTLPDAGSSSYKVIFTPADAENYDYSGFEGWNAVSAVIERDIAVYVEQIELGIVWGNDLFTFDGTEHAPSATPVGVLTGDSIELSVSGAEINANADGESYTATITGIDGADADNYRLPSEVTRSFTIEKAEQTAPTVGKTDETISGKADGSISGLNISMQYRAEGETEYTDITVAEIGDLASGKYYVRYKGDVNHLPSPDTEVTVSAGRKLVISVPQDPVGYTVTVDKSELDYGEQFSVAVNLSEGYTATEQFKIKFNDWESDLTPNETHQIYDTVSDQAITVIGVADVTAPLAEINVADNGWNSFINGITFGLFFRETQSVTIDASDSGSGIKDIHYCLTSEILTEQEVAALNESAWTEYTDSFKIDPDNMYVVYVRATDNAGNVVYVSSNGMIFDATAPTLEGIEDGEVYYGSLTVIKGEDQWYDIASVTLDGEPMGFEEGIYGYVPADNDEHTIIVTDRAGNYTEYNVKVYEIHKVTFMVDGKEFAVKQVGHGCDTEMPDIPAKEGYDRTAPVWDCDGKAITEDTVINAVYTINEYTVTYLDGNNTVKVITVKHGETFTPPAVPEKAGYKIVWEKELDQVTGDYVIKAVYAEIPSETPNAPQTGIGMSLWILSAVAFVSGGFLFKIILFVRKKEATEN